MVSLFSFLMKLLVFLLPFGQALAVNTPTSLDEHNFNKIIEKQSKNMNPATSLKEVGVVPMIDSFFLAETQSGAVHFISGPNARYLLNGTIYDSWTRSYITNLKDLEKSKHVPIETIGVKVNELAHFQVGNNKIPKQGTIFVEPLSKSSVALLQYISKNPENFNLDIVVVASMKKGSLQESKRIWCSPDRKRALQDLIDATRKAPPSSDNDCNIEPLIRSSIALNLLNIKAVPHFIRTDGLMYSGTPKDLISWLNTK